MLPEGHEGIDTTEPMPISAWEPLDWLAKLDAIAAERAALVPVARPVSRSRASLPPPRRSATGSYTALKAAPLATPALPASVAPQPVDMTSPLELDELEPVNLTAPLDLDELEPVEAAEPSVPLVFEATPTPLPPPFVLEDSQPFAPLRLDESAPVGLTERFDRSSTYSAPIAARAIPVRVIAAAVVGIAVVAVAVVAIRGSSRPANAPAAQVVAPVATVESAPVAAPLPAPQPVVAPAPPVAAPPVVEPKPIAKPRPQKHTSSVWAQAAAATPTAKTGTLMISTKPPCAIVVDGKPTRLMTPQRALALPVGNHTLAFVDAQKKLRGKLAIQVEAQRTTKIIRDFMH